MLHKACQGVPKTQLKNYISAIHAIKSGDQQLTNRVQRENRVKWFTLDHMGVKICQSHKGSNGFKLNQTHP